jgi:hypothetical protein
LNLAIVELLLIEFLDKSFKNAARNGKKGKRFGQHDLVVFLPILAVALRRLL